MWDAYFKGDTGRFTGFFDEHITIIGTSESEFHRDKKEAIDFYTLAADEVVGKIEFRNSDLQIKSIGDIILTVEKCDVFILSNDKWSFYAKARISMLLRKQDVFSIIALACFASFPLTAFAQADGPRPSLGATVSQRLGTETDITIQYSRPGVKGRTVWGDR